MAHNSLNCVPDLIWHRQVLTSTITADVNAITIEYELCKNVNIQLYFTFTIECASCNTIECVFAFTSAVMVDVSTFLCQLGSKIRYTQCIDFIFSICCWNLESSQRMHRRIVCNFSRKHEIRLILICAQFFDAEPNQIHLKILRVRTNQAENQNQNTNW